jgi:hypothetical protein
MQVHAPLAELGPGARAQHRVTTKRALPFRHQGHQPGRLPQAVPRQRRGRHRRRIAMKPRQVAHHIGQCLQILGAHLPYLDP